MVEWLFLAVSWGCMRFVFVFTTAIDWDCVAAVERLPALHYIDGWLRMGLLPPREFCRHILSCRELKTKSFKRCLHSVLRGVGL